MEPHNEKLLQRFEGQLSKYTNVIKGWQNRWFVLDPNMGTLTYFLLDGDAKTMRTRGCIHLAAAVISPSDEDSNTFSVISTTGDMYKLCAVDARSRQEWVNRLRAVSEMHTTAIAQNNPPLPPRDHLGSSQSQNPMMIFPLAILDAFTMVRNHLQKAEVSNSQLIRAIEDLPSSGPGFNSCDPDLLVLKATTNATLQCLGQCLSILQQQQLAPPSTPGTSTTTSLAPRSSLTKKNSLPINVPSSPSHFEGKKRVGVENNEDTDSDKSEENEDPFFDCSVKSATVARSNTSSSINPAASLADPDTACNNEDVGKAKSRQGHRKREKEKHLAIAVPAKAETRQYQEPASSSTPAPVTPTADLTTELFAEATVDDQTPPPPILDDEEVTDEEDDRALSSSGRTFQAEENKSVILHLLSQLKLGMDLTRVVLPTFILERRSLLEMFADCLGHPNLFIRVMDCDSPEERMTAVVEWYLTSLHIGRDTSIAKKPYNPIIGETFHCSWKVRDDIVRYTSEQVSHHPPVTAFYAEVPTRNMCLNASIWTKSNFSGMSVGVTMMGEVNLHVGDRNERYDFTLPSAYARSIISVPWVELGGKVNLNCAATGYSANIIFHTKPFYGGKVHQVTGEVKNSEGVNVCKIQGEWNSYYEFTYQGGRTSLVDVTKLPIVRKRVRPLEKQGPMESRKLWRNVTTALEEGDINAATDYKRALEEQQRGGEKHRLATGEAFPTRYFEKTEDDTWVYKNMLVVVRDSRPASVPGTSTGTGASSPT